MCYFSLRAGSLVRTGSLDRELALPTLFLASPVLGTSEPARRLVLFCIYSVYICEISRLKATSARRDGGLFAPSSRKTEVTGLLEVHSFEGAILTSGEAENILSVLKKEPISKFAEFLLHRR